MTQCFRKICTSHIIERVRKGLLKVLLWEGVGDRTELQHIDLHSYGHQRCVFLVLQGCSTGGPGAHSAGCRLPLPHLVTNGSGLQNNWLPIFTDLYNSSIAHSISLEWHVWLSSSGNNCHAVHRTLSSSASVYDCTIGFNLVPYCQPSLPTRFLPITAIGMCHFPLSLEWHVWSGRRSTYDTKGNDPQVNVIAWLEFDLVYYDDTNHDVRHCASGIRNEYRINEDTNCG